jgi:hypothetical protein
MPDNGLLRAQGEPGRETDSRVARYGGCEGRDLCSIRYVLNRGVHTRGLGWKGVAGSGCGIPCIRHGFKTRL